MRLTLRSERVLIGSTLQAADIIIEHDRINEIAGHGTAINAIDLGRRLVAPGFIDLHSDAVEKEIEPRPGAAFPVDTALVELDKKLAMAGITTMFHAIAFNDESLVGRRGTETASALISSIAQNNGTSLAIDNLIHARYEITSFSSVPALLRHIAGDRIQLLSFMDHSPGQGQFHSLEKWKQYHIPVFELKEDEVETIVACQLEKKNHCMKHLHELAVAAKAHGVLIASHDDDSSSRIDLMNNLGVTIAEFPLTLQTAAYAKTKGMATGMGAPNVVRNGSQSGNISARLLIEHGYCDFLCSDYHPSSLLQAVYAMYKELGINLAEALSFVTSTPAGIAGLSDRGEIAPMKLADIVVIEDHRIPRVVLTLKSGSPVYSNSCFCLFTDLRQQP